LGEAVIRYALIVFFVLLTGSVVAHAELAPAVHDALSSTALAQTRLIDVYLPKDADKNPAQRYETIYVLDGDWNTDLVVQTVDFLQGRGLMPPVIVVSVPNHFDEGVNSRDRDLTPSPQPQQARSGGAAQFMAFLKTELIPYVSKRYPSNGVNLVHGHSYGGLFLAYVIANDPSVFDGYMLLDPAMWWNNKEVAKTLEEKLPGVPTKGKAVYIAGRAGAAFKGMGVDSLQTAFAKAPKDLPWKVAEYPAESHDSMKFKATYDALRFMYRGYTKADERIDVRPDTGIVAPGKPLTIEVDSQMADIHYTTDGSEPTRLSPLLDHTLAFSDPARTRLKLISTRGEFDRDIPMHLRTGAVLKPAHATAPGEKTPLHYAYYDEKSWPRMSGKPFEQGETDKADPADPAREHFAARYERNYVIPSDGYYVVFFRSSQDAQMWFAGQEIGRTQAHKDPSWRGQVLPLQAGVYPARLDYRHMEKNAELEVHLFTFDEQNATWEKEVK
jgi:predicted alpha/beta superfamily hydrolase